MTLCITRLASKEIFSPSNKIHREVGRAKDLSAPRYHLPKNWLTLYFSGMESRIVCHPSHSLITILTELSRLLIIFMNVVTLPSSSHYHTFDSTLLCGVLRVLAWPSTRNSHVGLVSGCIILAFAATLYAMLQRNRTTSLIYITHTHSFSLSLSLSHTHTHTHTHTHRHTRARSSVWDVSLPDDEQQINHT